ncbi:MULTISPECIES: SHOCT domain-containing protein [Nonomuraea]|jgi:putative membrane protein|uniref:SHOCT domain-containing protein n=3 Tax=Nonomuraea TaxID=83681 RepID=A0ABW1C4I9_9ACTN|nr:MULTISPECIES: SHOCT domain-containing protein [Nonomuraea]MDA0639729.1 hypothetical protein [Nonomuraea ferruginea]TXK35619.1 SHOCT domain-containing protein [Nonomuraea sp. C10]
MMWDYGAGSWLVGGITMILIWALIITAIVALVRYIGGSRNTGMPWNRQGSLRPEDVLAERLARGEVDVDEYKRRLELLQGRR